MTDRAREIHGVDPGDRIGDSELLAELCFERDLIANGADVPAFTTREEALGQFDIEIAKVRARLACEHNPDAGEVAGCDACALAFLY